MELKSITKVPLDIPKGYSVTCVMQTQAGNMFRIRLVDEQQKDLMSPIERKSLQPLPPEYGEISSFQGENCFLIVDVQNSQNLDVRILVNDFNGKTDDVLLVRNYTVIAEDYIDADYNDLFLTVTVYKKKH